MGILYPSFIMNTTISVAGSFVLNSSVASNSELESKQSKERTIDRTLSLTSSLSSIRLTKEVEFRFIYKPPRKLGASAYEEFHEGIRRSDELSVNIKTIHKTKDTKYLGTIPREVALMQKLEEVPGVVKLIDFFE